MEIYVIHAHPVGEDSEVFWISVGKTREDAMERLKRLLTRRGQTWTTPSIFQTLKNGPCRNTQKPCNL